MWRGIDPRSAERLDRFEGALYERRSLPVRTSEGVIPADVYVTPADRLDELSVEPWDRLRFARESLADFVRAIRLG